MARFEFDTIVFSPRFNNNGFQNLTMAYSRKPFICKIDDLPRVLKMILALQLLYATKPRDDEWSKTK